MDFNDIKDKLVEEKDKVEAGLEKAAEFAKDKVHGHDDQIDQGVDKAKDYLDSQEKK